MESIGQSIKDSRAKSSDKRKLNALIAACQTLAKQESSSKETIKNYVSDSERKKTSKSVNAGNDVTRIFNEQKVREEDRRKAADAMIRRQGEF
jgi:hypothetical protein